MGLSLLNIPFGPVRDGELTIEWPKGCSDSLRENVDREAFWIKYLLQCKFSIVVEDLAGDRRAYFVAHDQDSKEILIANGAPKKLVRGPK